MPLSYRRLLSLTVGSMLCLAAPAFAQSAEARSPVALKGPILGGASNFSQGRTPGLLNSAKASGVRWLRDGMRWDSAERERGVYDFAAPQVDFPKIAGGDGFDLSIVLNWGNRLYDGGDTPQSPEALAAFGNFAGALVKAFPAISSLEVGNEFNGVNFVRGPLKEVPPKERARAYVPFLAAAATAARKERPNIRISGGSTHSMAAGYLWEVLDAGGGQYLDSLAIHPYTTPAEQLVRQVEVLRRHPQAATLPIEVTEFGDRDAEDAGDHFLRNYCQMALSGVSHAVWYPVNRRDDGYAPLFEKDGEPTAAGRAYKLATEKMEGRDAASAATDPFTYGCRFGDDVLVLWGEPRSVDVAEGVDVTDAQGNPVEAPYRMASDAPLVFIRDGGVVADAVTLSSTNLVADSFYQFAYPIDEEAKAGDDPFERFARRGDVEIPLKTLPGQERDGEPWYPYRGNRDIWPVRLTATTLLPGGTREEPVALVHRYTAPEAERVDIEAHFKAGDRSEDGIKVTVYRNGDAIFEASGKDRISVEENAVELAQGDRLEFVVDPNGTSQGDLTNFRIRLLQSGS